MPRKNTKAGPRDWPFDQASNVAAVSDAFVLEDSAPILLVVHYSDDDSWGFFSGQPFTDEQGKVIGMGTALRLDPTLRTIADLPSGWTATRATPTTPWKRQPDPEV
jgi:hypothetical protein